MSSDKHLAEVGDDIHAAANEMGTSSSKPVTRGLILSFDALGTLYRFRKPVAEQYLDVAKRCGLKATVVPDDLQQSFRQAYKSMIKEHPNYGKASIDSPAEWWNQLVSKSFSGVTKEALPDDLGSAMYEHFSSSAAYELYPDVKPLFARLHELRGSLKDDEDRLLVTGVISNSDPRVKDVLRSLSLRCGATSPPERGLDYRSMKELSEKHAAKVQQTGVVNLMLPGHDYYNAQNDLDFVATSYNADSEKPDPGIFAYAQKLAEVMPISRAMQAIPPTGSRMTAAMGAMRSVLQNADASDSLTWIHIGDDFEKDYIGAKESGLQALHLVRDGEGTAIEGTRTVLSLFDVTALVNLIVQNDFEVQE